MPAQQYLLEAIGVEPAAGGEAVVPARRTQDERWAVNLAAARQFHDREGHLVVPRKHVETITTGGGGDGNGGGQEVSVKLGAWLDNSRRGVAGLSPERRAALDALGMRW
ncbi:helicase associated domain-containing protein [Streptomyces sp. Tue6028]|uniref:helicase associated domain-containing protein n=1 Tax=Streptomyces sp. Tue6028 TaxID=2036037 RepID=UPI003D710BAF